MTDWGAIRECVPALEAGLDLEMPGDTPICRRILDGIVSGGLSKKALDDAAMNVLNLVEKYAVNAGTCSADFDAHNALADQIAEDCAVLMKNDGILPLRKNSAGGLQRGNLRRLPLLPDRRQESALSVWLRSFVYVFQLF